MGAVNAVNRRSVQCLSFAEPPKAATRQLEASLAGHTLADPTSASRRRVTILYVQVYNMHVKCFLLSHSPIQKPELPLIL